MFLFDLTITTPTPEADTPVSALWYFLPFGYLLTILVETPVLLFGLPTKISIKQRLFSGVWLSACTYPIVVLVLPMVFADRPRWQFLTVAETFAPVAESVLFWAVFRGRIAISKLEWSISFFAIVLANLASFGIGEIFNYYAWFGLL